MAPRTPRSLQTAGPFVTLSLSKSSALKLSVAPSDSGVPVDPSNTSPVNNKKEASSKQTSLLNHESAAPDSTPSSDLKKLSQITSPNASLARSSILSFKYSTPHTAHIGGRDARTNSIQSSGTKRSLPAKSIRKEDSHWLDGQRERRSSTASLTDTGTRSSARARKLTSKAQALAGTNFLPSLQNTPDAESVLGQTDADDVAEQTIGNQNNRAQAQSKHGTPEPVTEDAPVESVEPPPVRISTRERKLTARAIELETTRASRKRPASPATGERAAKFGRKSRSTSAKPSKLRYPIIGVENTTTVENDADVNETKEAQTIANGFNSREIHIQPPMSPYKARCEPSINPTTQDTTSNQSRDRILEVESTPQELLEKEQSAPCDLACLSPSARLLAFAKVAFEWTDSDDDSSGEEDDNLDLTATSSEGSTFLLEKVRQAHCQCVQKASNLETMTLANSPSLQPANVGKEAPTNAAAGDGFAHTKASLKRIVGPARRSTREKFRPLVQQPEAPTAKRQKTNHNVPNMERQSSNFEQRMQADYLASQRNILVTRLSQPLPVADTRINVPHVNKFPAASTFSPQPIRFKAIVDDNPSNSPGLHNNASGTANQIVVNDLEPSSNRETTNRQSLQLNHTTKPPVASSVQHNAAQNTWSLAPLVRPMDGKAANRPMKKTNRTGIRGGGKSSAGGSVRMSLQEKPGHESVQAVKQYPTLVTPKPTSIKLRFTTTAK